MTNQHALLWFDNNVQTVYMKIIECVFDYCVTYQENCMASSIQSKKIQTDACGVFEKNFPLKICK
jgi:hypothetical protein